jgi:hypothetical protein
MCKNTFRSAFYKKLPNADAVLLKKCINCILRGDWEGLQRLILVRGDSAEMISPANFDIVRKVAPKIFERVLENISCKKICNFKMLDSSSFFPLQHCRTCGKVQGKLKICRECVNEEDFPAPNLFCGKDCEKFAMENFHEEEHAKHLMVKCGLYD